MELVDALDAASEDVPRALVSDAARRAWRALPVDLRGEPRWAMIECHFDARAHCDLVLEVEPARDGAGSVHVELDASEAGWSERIVFTGLEPRPGLSPAPGWEDRLHAALAARGGYAAASLAPVLARLPREAWVAHAASLRPHGRDAVRLVLSLAPAEVASALARLGWGGDPRAPGALAAEVARGLGRTQVHVDVVGEALGPSVGIEVYFPGRPAEDARWAPTMARLRALDAAKTEALDGWPGAHRGFLRHLGVKLVCDLEGGLGAKAYLVFRARKPGAIIESQRSGWTAPAASTSPSARARSSCAPRSSASRARAQA